MLRVGVYGMMTDVCRILPFFSTDVGAVIFVPRSILVTSTCTNYVHCVCVLPVHISLIWGAGECRTDVYDCIQQ